MGTGDVVRKVTVAVELTVVCGVSPKRLVICRMLDGGACRPHAFQGRQPCSTRFHETHPPLSGDTCWPGYFLHDETLFSNAILSTTFTRRDDFESCARTAKRSPTPLLIVLPALLSSTLRADGGRWIQRGHARGQRRGTTEESAGVARGNQGSVVQRSK